MNVKVRVAARCLGSLAAAVLVFGPLYRIPAQGPNDPVEKLRQALASTADNLPERELRTKACLGELRSLGELHRAVVLREWRHHHPDAKLAALDQANRDALAERFRQATRQLLAGSDSGALLAALEMLSDTATSMRAVGEPPSLTQPLTADVARLVGEGEPSVRAAAAKALGLIEPEIGVALQRLVEVSKSPDVQLRIDAATALGQILDTTAQPWTTSQFNPNARPDRRAAVDAAVRIVPVAGSSAADPSREVRRRSLTTLALGATLLARLSPPLRIEAPDSTEAAQAIRRADAEREEARPLAVALCEQLPQVIRCLTDAKAEMRMAAVKALEETAQARRFWVWRAAVIDEKPDDPLAAGLAAALPAMGQLLADADVTVRRGALATLEVYGPLASAAAPAVTRALKDDDRFVRWSAVRALGAIGPEARPAIPALTRLLQDPDLDVRLAAAAVLEVLDPTGQGVKKPGQPNGTAPRSALPALIQSLTNDQPEMRLAAIRALAGMGTRARPAIPALAAAVGDADPRVRVAAIQTLGGMGTAARPVADTLRRAMNDDNADVRHAAGDALLNLEREP
jgi:HEAT repeat protein